MPLLKHFVFEKSKPSEFLQDNEEVFHCEVTNEIFRDYEEFCERIILVNSMVWSCSMTGKTNLTYAEALESEENARKSLRDFPPQLRVPILFLGSKTKRCAFTEMAEDVWSFAKERYFVGEIVEACLSTGSWYKAQVLQVMAPQNDHTVNNSEGKSVDQFYPPAANFRYEVEQASDDNQVFIVEASKVRRKTRQYTREKNRLFLKQFAQQSAEGVWRIKEPIVQKYDIRRVTFEEIFDGPFPDFTTSKKIIRKQETLTKYLTKTNGEQSSKLNDSKSKIGRKSLLEEMKRRETELKEKTHLEKQRKLEEKEKAKQKIKEENHKNAILTKEWNKLKDDLELEDHKKLPVPTPVSSRISENHFGDAIMILDFINSFSDILLTKKYFPGGFTIDLLERALIDTEVKGPLSDLIKLLLNALFKMQNEEAAEMQKDPVDVKIDNGADGNVTVARAIRLATAAASWCSSHQGIPLSRMPLDGLTLTEVLRLHLLSSGSRMTERAAKWQYHQRGGYMCEDDPGLTLRIEHPHVIKMLAERHVAELVIEDKLKILTCLTNQILSYANARDIVEDRLDRLRQAKIDLKTLQIVERKRESEFNSLRSKTKKECKRKKIENPSQSEMYDREFEVAMKKLEKDNEKKISTFIEKNQDLIDQTNIKRTRISYLGLDRAYRRYIYVDSIPALFVEQDEMNPGTCLDKVVFPNPDLIDASQENILQYIRNLYFDMTGSNDKENDLHKQKLSPKKNGIHKNAVIKLENVDIGMVRDMFMCTANGDDCLVHSSTTPKPKWSFFYNRNDISTLITSLNKRGVRESELRQTLENSQLFLEEQLEYCPADKLSSEIKLEVERPVRKSLKTRYENSNMNFEPGTEISEILELTLRDFILDLEQQMHSGGLGTLQVPDRDLWRGCLKDRNYDLNCLRIVSNTPLNDIKNEEKLTNGSRSSTPECSETDNGICDPGIYLRDQLDSHSEKISQTNALKSNLNQAAILGLATALQSVAYCVNEKYLNRPLGHANKKFNKKKKDDLPEDLLEKWKVSLMLSTSFSQLLLHYSTLESCVALDKSALNARCFTCRRCTNDDQLLLCDGCNRGQHLYCTEPKLMSVPTGDWFCDRCKPPDEPPAKQNSRKRRIFSEASDDEHSSILEQDSEYVQPKSSDTDESENEAMESINESIYESCEVCKEGGNVVCCDKCSKLYHPDCLNPPMRRIPRGSWYCSECKRKEVEDGAKRSRAQRVENRNVDRALDFGWCESSASAASSDVDTMSSSLSGARRCARQARHKIHGFARTLRRPSLDSSSEGEESTPSSTKGAQRRSRRAYETSDDLPLHNAPLQELLSDVLKHDDAWPFTQPVQKRDVPDYFEVITHPMDFGTIKYKLNMGKYQYDAELMADAMLVFDNCNTYNDSDAAVYKCGVKLLKFFKQKAKELGLMVPKVDNDLHDDAEEGSDDGRSDSPIPRKKARTRIASYS